MKRYNLLRIALLLMLSAATAGCATMYNPATGREEIIFIDSSSEISIGKAAASQIGEKYRLSDNPQDLERLERMGRMVAAASDRQDLDYKFYLVEEKEFNAFTIPGGHVYIYRGLYEILDDDELACVMGHEIGHVAARHIVKKMQASLGYQIVSTVALAALGRGSDDKKKTAAYTAYAASTAFNLVMLGYSREDEYQADELGVRYARSAGFNPRGMITSLEKLKKNQERGLPVPYILRSHPYLDQRIERIEAML